MSDGKHGCLGCLGIIGLFVIVVRVGAFVEKTLAERREQAAVERARESKRQEEERRLAEYQARQEETRRLAAEAKAVEARRMAANEDKLRTFSLQNAEELWRTYQLLKDAVAEQDKRIEELKKSFALFGRAVDEDADYKAILAKRDGMVQAVGTLHKKIEDAYLAWVKFQATPGRAEYAEVLKKALQDGIQEASAAESRFKDMCKAK